MRRIGAIGIAIGISVGVALLAGDGAVMHAEVGLCPIVLLEPAFIQTEESVVLAPGPWSIEPPQWRLRAPRSRPPLPELPEPGEALVAPPPTDPAKPDSPLDDMAPPSALSVGDSAWAVMAPLLPPSRAPTVIARRESPRDDGQRLRDSINARDAELGLRLPAAGSIASALRASVRAHTPPVSTATFVATIDATGTVTEIAVAFFSAGARSGWRAAAREAEAALAGQRFALRGDLPHGALVTVRLVQNLELPSGSGRVHRLEDRPRLPWEPAPFESRLSRREEGTGTAFFLPPDLERLGDPESMVAPRSARLGPVPSAGGSFDLSDIGAHEQRVVKVATSVASRERPVADR